MNFKMLIMPLVQLTREYLF